MTREHDLLDLILESSLRLEALMSALTDAVTAQTAAPDNAPLHNPPSPRCSPPDIASQPSPCRRPAFDIATLPSPARPSAPRLTSQPTDQTQPREESP